MKVRNLTPTKAKLPDNEKLIGGENNKTTVKNNLKAIEKQAQTFLKNAKK